MKDNHELTKEELRDALISAMRIVKERTDFIEHLEEVIEELNMLIQKWQNTAMNLYSLLHGTKKGFKQVLEQTKVVDEIAELRRIWDLTKDDEEKT